ncbi:LAMI_0H12970g1_1 [Lachancea mirantina]|uniref:Man(5)GlcNAc(2)-PP-dolichol translocation protein RFT1 n=1 Tax=Lachancea mirantina TaxID=1230905 RepID=A0A1G4KHU4_9SACH|nr:LAMI_0H12970g1_1 [Lachancea mirantina]
MAKFDGDESFLIKSTKGAQLLMFNQIFTKAVTFLLNNLLIRYLSPRVFGINAFLEFLISTTLFFSREAIRLSTLRIKPVKSADGDEEGDELDSKTLQTVVNFASVSIAIGIPLSIALIAWQCSNLNEFFLSLPYFKAAILLVWLSIICELLSEPFFIVNQFILNYEVRSRFETIAVTLGCLMNFGIVWLHEKRFNGSGSTLHDSAKQEGIAIAAFATSKFTYSLALLCCYYYDYFCKFRPNGTFSVFPVKLQISSGTQAYYLQADILQHFRKVYFQLCFKHLLTEGDKLIINSMCSVEEQGIYSLLSNYGSLVTRLLFAPIEESLRLFLTRLLSVQSNKNLRLSMEVLINLTRFYLYLSLLICVFGPTNSSFLLQFLIGSKWSSTSVLDTIRIYCFYLPFLSINGIFEAFFQSVASGEQILKHSYAMMLFSGVFLSNCWVLISYFGMSLDGLILSNIINMVLRIAYCYWFINGFYKDLFLETSDRKSFLLNFKNLKVASFASICIALANFYFIGTVRNFKHLAINAVAALGLLCLILYKERQQIRALVQQKSFAEQKEF